MSQQSGRMTDSQEERRDAGPHLSPGLSDR